MKRGKKICNIFLALLTIFALSACGKDSDSRLGRFQLQGFYVVDISPKESDTVVSGSEVRVTFSEVVDQTTMASGFKLTENCGATTTTVQGSFDYQNQGTVVVFRPSGAGLRSNCVYTLDIYASVTSKASGNKLVTPVSGYQFGYNNGAMSIPGKAPYVTNLFPEPGTYYIGQIYMFQATFSEPIADQSVNGMYLQATDVLDLAPGYLVPLEISTAQYGNSKIWYLYPLEALSIGKYKLCFNNIVDFDNEMSGLKCYNYTLLDILG